MKKCVCNDNNCNGKIERFKVHSPENDAIYPNRFWGVTDYCETHAKEDLENGFVLTKANNEKAVFTL